MKKAILSLLLIGTLLLSACAAGDMSYDSGEVPTTEANGSDDGGAVEMIDEMAEADYMYPQESLQSNGDLKQTSGDMYLGITENDAVSTAEEMTLTFSLKVDTASYSNVSRYIHSQTLPPADAVKTEELINYFTYDGGMSFGNHPFSIYTEVGESPFGSNKYMAFVRVKSQDIDKEELPSSNLTFLIDTSGSMDSHDKMPLLKQAFSLLVENLDEDDRVSIVTYAGSSEIVLDSVSGANKEIILFAINDLSASGSTAGANGIITAYALSEKNYMEGGNNRIILASDGDFNVGITNLDDLKSLITNKKESGYYLSVLGFGAGNLRDDIMETLAANGNGNYSYIDTVSTAEKVLVEEMGSNLFTIADDVKAQVEFNSDLVKNYRLIGYENRRLNNEDFEDDSVDAGEIGVGTDVVIMFELEFNDLSGTPSTEEIFDVRIRYKNPGEEESILMTEPVSVDSLTRANTSDFAFACSVAAFGHLLRDSQYSREIGVDEVISMASQNLGADEKGYRLDHLILLREYKNLMGE